MLFFELCFLISFCVLKEQFVTSCCIDLIGATDWHLNPAKNLYCLLAPSFTFPAWMTLSSLIDPLRPEWPPSNLNGPLKAEWSPQAWMTPPNFQQICLICYIQVGNKGSSRLIIIVKNKYHDYPSLGLLSTWRDSVLCM